MVEDGKPEAPNGDVKEKSEAERQDEKHGDDHAAGIFFHCLEYVETAPALSSDAMIFS